MSTRYSYSKINQFDTCPRQYKFEQIEKAQVEKPVSVEAYLGKAVHASLEQLYKYKMDGKILPFEKVIAFYKKIWDGPDRERIKVTVENMAVEDYIARGESGLKKYYDKYHPFDEGEIIGLEKYFRFTLDPEGRYVFSGKIDKLLLRPDGFLELVDYKTTRHLITQPALDRDMQMGLYRAAANELWPQYERIELKQVFPMLGQEMKTVMPDEIVDEIRFAAFQKIQEIIRAEQHDDFPPKESGLCDYCVYYHLCPAKRHRLALQDDSEEPFDPNEGSRLAEEYLDLYRKKKQIESDLDALKEDIARFCREMDLSRIDSESGYVRMTSREKEEFPSMTKNQDAFVAMSELMREAKIDEAFKLDVRALYRDFFAKGFLPDEIMGKLKQYLITRIDERITPKLTIKDKTE